MRDGPLFPKTLRFVLRAAAAAVLSLWLPIASAQSPPIPAPVPPNPPATPTVDDSPAQLAARLRKMEEMNQKLLQQFEVMAKQNESITKQNERLTEQVQKLSRRLDDSSVVRQTGSVAEVGAGGGGGGGDSTAPSLSESAARPSRSPGGGTPGMIPIGGGTTAGAGGTDGTAPSISESAGRPSRTPGGGASNRIKLDAFYDMQRYGYLLQSENQEFELRFNALLQTDARLYPNSRQSSVVNDLDIPRARLYFSGRMTKPIEYQISLQKSVNSLDLLNAYINLHYDDRLQVRVGRYKPPYTFEWYKESIWEMLTPDRSLFGLNYGPNRMVGAMGWGFLFDERLEYAVGMFGGGRNSYQDFNDAKDVMALLDYKPFFQSGNLALKNFAVGGSFDQGQQNNPLSPSVLRTSTPTSTSPLSSTTGDNLIAVPFLAFNGNVRERGDRSLGELHTTYFYKGLSLLGVWDFGNNDYALTTAGANPVHVPVGGYFVQGGYLLTGETRERLGLVAPLRPFDLRKGKTFGLGAFEVQARYSTLNIGNQVFTGGLADPNLWTDRVEMLDLGFNWYLNKFTKFYFDWEHATFARPVFDGPGGFQKSNDLFWLRLQIYL
jgi:phosphate-selective porin OprO and OprP